MGRKLSNMPNKIFSKPETSVVKAAQMMDCAANCSPACDFQQEFEQVCKELELEKEMRKNLQHVIVSQWGVDSISKCIATIQEVEKDLGPFGPINDFSLAKILSAHLQQPAELIINDLRQQIKRYQAVIEQLYDYLFKKEGEYCEKSQLEAAFAYSDAQNKLGELLLKYEVYEKVYI